MPASSATSVAQYLAELPPERRAVVSRVRDVVREHLPAGYAESIEWGMICWSVPLSRQPDTYNGKPLGYVFLAAQKNYYVLHLPLLYMEPARSAEFARAYAAAGRRLDMGKGCVRFRTIEALPLDVVGETVGSTTPEELIAAYVRMRGDATTRRRAATTRKAVATKAAAKKAASKKAATRRPAAKKTKRAAAKRR
jgi:hypothetical protein